MTAVRNRELVCILYLWCLICQRIVVPYVFNSDFAQWKYALIFVKGLALYFLNSELRICAEVDVCSFGFWSMVGTTRWSTDRDRLISVTLVAR